jgi:3-oxoacyl-[acyl-carrier-protein] synthase II
MAQAKEGNRPRVVITGMGVVSPVGTGTELAWDALLEGRSGGGPITHFDPDDQYATRIACEVKGFDPEPYMDAKDAAGLAGPPEGTPAERFGVIYGSGIGGIQLLEDQCKILQERGPRRVSPFFVPMFIPDIAAGLISIRFGAEGPNYATVSACASSAHAIGDAMRMIQRGDADIMIAGGTEATISPLAIAGFSAMKAMSTRNDDPQHASRPFDAERDGFVIGEGSSTLVLESLEHAERRGATIHGELVGYGLSADAFHITSPAPEHRGAQVAMRLAMEDAGVELEDVEYINAHGTSTPQNDERETEAIKAVFGEHAYKMIVGSTKSMTGHLLGAAGALEAVITTLVCKNGTIPPTINFTTPDPACDLDYAHSGRVDRPIEIGLSNSFGFGGHNVCLALRRWEG